MPLEQMSDFYGKVMRDDLFKAGCEQTWPGRVRISLRAPMELTREFGTVSRGPGFERG